MKNRFLPYSHPFAGSKRVRRFAFVIFHHSKSTECLDFHLQGQSVHNCTSFETLASLRCRSLAAALSGSRLASALRALAHWRALSFFGQVWLWRCPLCLAERQLSPALLHYGTLCPCK